MDDPWGSPWAATDSSTNLEPFPRSSATLELPSRTLTRNRSFSAQSPWAAEDDGFADWSSAGPGLTLPPTALAASPNPSWSAWGGENGINNSQTHLSSRGREGSFGPSQPSPTLWPAPASPAIQPPKSVSRRSSSKSLSLFRQPSPDPWAAEFSQNRLSLPPAVHNSSTDQLPFAALERHDEEPEPVALEPTENHSVEPMAQNVPDRESEARPTMTENHQNSPPLSRHSSVSDDSHHDGRPPESPITSMDEDAKDRPAITRRSSVKVQELVHMYDGLARKRSQSLLTPDVASGRQRSASRSTSVRSGRTDDASDFGDFEDAHDEELVRTSRRPSTAGSPKRTATRAGRLGSISKSSLRASPTPLSLPVPSPVFEEVSSKFNLLREKFGPAKFDVDLEGVHKLFNVETLDREQPSAKDYSLDAIDGIIKDSFSTVSERKAWYRISRPGTLRKHNMGDDDNYRRVTWADSNVRQDVTVTVRRWIEEGSYSGRSTMGGGPAVKSGGFNWDAKTKSEPLSFDQIFGKRKSVEPMRPVVPPIPRPLSLQPETTRPAHSRNSSAGVKSLPPKSPLSIPEPPSGPAFAWSTGPNGTFSDASPRPSSQFTRQSLEVNSMRPSLSRNTSIHESDSRSSLQLAPPPAAPTLATSMDVLAPSISVAHENQDEDEEWGDMVASPAAESRPISVLFDNSINGSMASLHAQFAEAPSQMSNHSLNGSTLSLHAQFADAPPPKSDATTLLAAVSSRLEETTQVTSQEASDAAAPLDVWDFSAFDSKPTIPSIPSTITSKPESDFDGPLQSPTPSISSRTGSLSPFPSPKPPTPAKAESPANNLLHQLVKSPATPSSVPIRPQHGQHRSKSSLSLIRPSPLHNVITPKSASPISTSPVVVAAAETNAKSVSFAGGEDEIELSEKDTLFVRSIVEGLPNLLYMLC